MLCELMLDPPWQTIRLHNAASPEDVRTFAPSKAPIFDVTWGGGANASKAYSGGLDRSVIESVGLPVLFRPKLRVLMKRLLQDGHRDFELPCDSKS